MAQNPERQQTWSADGYAKNARFVADLAGGVLEWLDVRANEEILDLGCGDGALTEKLVNAGASVRGLDKSPELLTAARARGLEVHEGDATAIPFEKTFDAVFSNAVLHWVKPPEAAAESILRALKPGGRFVAEFGGHGNVAAIVTAMRAVGEMMGGDPDLAGPWYFPTPEEYAALLTTAGFRVDRAGLFPRPTPLPTGMQGWLMTFRAPFFNQFGSEGAKEAVAKVEGLLRPVLCDSAGQWTADYVRIRVHATKPRMDR